MRGEDRWDFPRQKSLLTVALLSVIHSSGRWVRIWAALLICIDWEWPTDKCVAPFYPFCWPVVQREQSQGQGTQATPQWGAWISWGSRLRASCGFGLCPNLSSLLALSLASLSSLSTYTWGLSSFQCVNTLCRRGRVCLEGDLLPDLLLLFESWFTCVVFRHQ